MRMGGVAVRRRQRTRSLEALRAHALLSRRAGTACRARTAAAARPRSTRDRRRGSCRRRAAPRSDSRYAGRRRGSSSRSRPLPYLPLSGPMRERARALALAPAGHAALADDELVRHVPGDAVLRDAAARAVGRAAVAVDHQVAAVLERDHLGRIAPDVGPFRRRPGEAVILGDHDHHVLGVARRIDVGAHGADEAAVAQAHQRRLLVVDDRGRVVGEGRVVLPVVAAIVRAHQRRARGLALALPPRSRGCGRRGPSGSSPRAAASSPARQPPCLSGRTLTGIGCGPGACRGPWT